MNTAPLWRRLFAEFLGSAFLAALVIGSGIAAVELSPNDVGLQLFYNSAATAAGLFAIILMFGPVSGGHFNPVVSLVDAAFGGLSWRDARAYIPIQIAGCSFGALVANVMFGVSAISISTHHRASPAHMLGEVVATLGLILLIFSLVRSHRAALAPAAVGAYIGAAYLVHVLGVVREPGDHNRPDVLQHLRRDRASLGASLHIACSWSAAGSRWS